MWLYHWDTLKRGIGKANNGQSGWSLAFFSSPAEKEAETTETRYVLGARLTRAGNWLLPESAYKEAGSCSACWKHIPGNCFRSLFAFFPLLQTFSIFHFTPKATDTSAISETPQVFLEWSTIHLQLIASNIEQHLHATLRHTVVLPCLPWVISSCAPLNKWYIRGLLRTLTWFHRLVYSQAAGSVGRVWLLFPRSY